VRSRPTEDALSERFGRAEAFKSFWVCITNDLEYLGSDGRHLVLRRDAEEGRKCGEIRNLVPFGESVGVWPLVGESDDVQAERRTLGSISF